MEKCVIVSLNQFHARSPSMVWDLQALDSSRNVQKSESKWEESKVWLGRETKRLGRGFLETGSRVELSTAPCCKSHRWLQKYWLISNALCSVKEAVFKTLHAVWFYLYDILEKASLRGRKQISSWQGTGEEDWPQRSNRGVLGVI